MTAREDLETGSPPDFALLCLSCLGTHLRAADPTRRGSMRQALRAGQALTSGPVPVHTPYRRVTTSAERGQDILSGLPSGSAVGSLDLDVARP